MKRLIIATALLISGSVLQANETTYEPCAACHGQLAEGNTSLLSPQLAGQDKTYLEEQLANFRDGKRGNHQSDTHGQIMMASTQGITNESIKTLASYLSELAPQQQSWTTDGDPAKGESFYIRNCGDCHGNRAQGIASVYAPNLIVLQDWYIRAQTKAYLNGWRGHVNSTTRAKGMRSMAEQFSNEQELEDVIAWLETLK